MRRAGTRGHGSVPGALLLGLTLLGLTLGACGEDELPPDAGTPDAGLPDAGVPDAGPGPDADILMRLQAIPGMTAEERIVAGAAGHRFFRLQYEQPVDHAQPGGQRFTQRMTLLHRVDAPAGTPMVLHTTGYYVFSNPRLEEPARLLEAHQLSVEHRYFEQSRPVPTDWRHLDIRQAAADFHRIVQALKPLYPVRWLSTGVSKGGETVVFHRRFYPDDVDATLAYSAPLVREDDGRFNTFLEGVGGDTYAACRERLTAFQRRVLERRAEMVQELTARAAQWRLQYTRLGYDKAVEHAAIEMGFAFWQGMNPVTQCDMIPAPEDTTAVHLDFLDLAVYLPNFSDRWMAVYEPYFYQAATELGHPRPWEAPLDGLLSYPGTDVPATYAPAGVSLTFDATAMEDVQGWVATQGERLMFLYGELDPWAAAAYSLGDARDSYLYVAPGWNHGTRLENLPEPLQTEALDTLRGWMGLPSLASVRRTHAPMLEGPAPEDVGPRRAFLR